MSTLSCSKCGASVSSDTRFCANCGARQPDVEAVTGPTQVLSAPNDAPTQGLYPLPPEQTTPLAPNDAPTQAFHSSSPEQTTPLPPRDAPTQALYSQSPTQAPLPTSEFAASPYMSGDPGATTSKKRNVLLIGSVVVLSLAGLCFVIGIAGIGVLTLLGGQVSEVFGSIETSLITDEPIDANRNDQPTSAEQTAQAVLQGFEGQESELRATAEALATEIAAPQPRSPRAPVDPEVLLASAQQVFRDEFADNRNNWFTGRFNDKETDLIEDGVFKIIWDKEGFSYEVYGGQRFTNFIADVDCLIVTGGEEGSCGLVFAQEDDVGQYEFEVFTDSYRLNVLEEDEWQTLLEDDLAGIVRPGEVNSLRVIRKDNDIHMYLNNQFLDSSSDSTYTSGNIGLSTNSYQVEGGIEIWFDNFTIWELP
jgi:hypothetical protein